MSKHPFEHFNLDSSLIDAVKDLNFNKPTQIQNRVIPKASLNKPTLLVNLRQELENHMRSCYL